jgi:WD40 repeat protein
MRTITCMLMVALVLVAAVRAAEPKPEKPALTLLGRAVVTIDGKEVGELRGPTSAVAYSPDGKLLASASSSMGGLVAQPYLPATTNVLPSASSAIKLWDARTGKELHVRLHGFEVVTLAFSPDGKRLVAACSEEFEPERRIPRGHMIKVWEAASGKELLNVKAREQLMCLAISPDGKRLASGSFKSSGEVDRPNVKVWDAETGKEIYAFGGMSGEAFCLAFSPDGKRLAAGTRNFADQVKAGGIRGEVRFWDLTTGKHVATWKPHGQFVKALTYSPDGKRLALGALADGGGVNKDAPVKVCDTETGRELLGLPDDEGELLRQAQYLAFSPDSRLLAVRLSEKNKVAVKVWDAATGNLLRTLPVDNADGGIAFAPDGARLAAGDSRGVTVWDIGP